MAILDWAAEAANVTNTDGLFKELQGIVRSPTTDKVDEANEEQDSDSEIFKKLLSKLFSFSTKIHIEYAEYDAYDSQLFPRNAKKKIYWLYLDDEWVGHFLETARPISIDNDGSNMSKKQDPKINTKPLSSGFNPKNDNFTVMSRDDFRKGARIKS